MGRSRRDVYDYPMSNSPDQPVDQDASKNRARPLWEQAGRPEGRAEAHWQQAEQELARPLRRAAPVGDAKKSEWQPRGGSAPDELSTLRSGPRRRETSRPFVVGGSSQSKPRVAGDQSGTSGTEDGAGVRKPKTSPAL